MNTIEDVVLGNLTVDGPTLLSGTVTGDLIVDGGGTEITGMVIGSVIVLDGDVLVGGTIGHDVINHGGNVRVIGTVTGEVFGERLTTRIDSRAKAKFSSEPVGTLTHLSNAAPTPAENVEIARPSAAAAPAVAAASAESVVKPAMPTPSSSNGTASRVHGETDGDTKEDKPVVTSVTAAAPVASDAAASPGRSAAAPSPVPARVTDAVSASFSSGELGFLENLAGWLPRIAD